MKNQGFKSWMLASCLLIAGTSVGARADIKYTQVNSTPFSDDGTLKPMMTMTTFTRAGQQRVDSSVQIAGFKQLETNVTTCAKHQRVTWDAALKIYTVESLDKNGQVVQPAAPADNHTSSQPAKHDTGKIVSTINVKALGTETVAGRLARHYLLNFDVQEYGCAGKDHIHTKQEIWIADVVIPAFDCGSRLDVAALSHAQFKSDCDCAFEQKGDISALANAYKGVIVKMKMFDGDSTKVIMAQETTMISQAKLTDADFNVPDGFKLLSEKEYQQARSKAMMHAMMGGVLSGNNDADNSDATQNTAQNNDNADNTSGNADKPKDNDNSDDSTIEDMGKAAAIGKLRSHIPGF